MTSLQIQFHAGPDEAVDLGLRWASMFDLLPVLEVYFPDYQAALAARSTIDLRIQLTGNREKDARIANKAAGLDKTPRDMSGIITRIPA